MTAFHVPPSWAMDEKEATPETVFHDRRRVVRGLGLAGIALGASTLAPGWARAAAGDEGAAVDGQGAADGAADGAAKTRPALGRRFAELFPAERNPAYSLGGRPLTDESVAALYSNFYEFTTAKERVWELARDYPVDPWKVEVRGLVKRPRTLDLDDIFGRFPLEERLYRFRCVERWAMQVPWVGYPLAKLISYLEPLPSARWVRLVTVLDTKGLPGQRLQRWYPWPYVEALRMDEATNPLTLAVVGSYGHALPMQHGAPWRVITPWKYGYKSPKSLVEIEFTAERPTTFWNDIQPEEYGFFSNVEPHKPHPRWSQQWEQDIGTGETRETLLYNGYGQQVGSMYDGSEI